MDLQPSRLHILCYWAGTPDQHRQTKRLYRSTRISAAHRELARASDDRSASPGYECVTRHMWANAFNVLCSPSAPTSLRYKPYDTLWWIGKISHLTTKADTYIVRFIDDPGLVKIALAPSRDTTA